MYVAGNGGLYAAPRVPVNTKQLASVSEMHAHELWITTAEAY